MSKLAQPGASSTVSPGCAIRSAISTASRIVAARSTGVPAAACSNSASFRGRKRGSLNVVPPVV